MIKIIAKADVPAIYKSEIGVSNFTPGYVYAEVDNLPQPIPGTELSSLSDYLDQFSRQNPKIDLPTRPNGIFSLETLE